MARTEVNLYVEGNGENCGQSVCGRQWRELRSICMWKAMARTVVNLYVEGNGEN